MTADSVFAVTVSGCTPEQALQVMAERLNHDEDYGFDYTVGFEVMEQVVEPVSTLPDFSMDVTGQQFGGAFWEKREYRVTMTREDSLQMFVEDAGGFIVSEPMTLTEELIDGITRMASTDHGLGGYEDDWTLPVGMDRVLTWTLPTSDHNHVVTLNEAQITEVAAWLRYATGEETYDGGPEWEF